MPSLSSPARRFSSVRSRFNLPELLLPPVRSQRVLPTVRVPRVPAARPLAVVVAVDVAVVVVLAAPVDLYVFTGQNPTWLPLVRTFD